MTITDRDREYAVAAAKECNGLNDVVEAIAQAREEGRQEEREACAKVCDEAARKSTELFREAEDRWDEMRAAETNAMARASEEIATAIRARGED